MELIEDIICLLHGLIFNSSSKIEMRPNPNRPVTAEEREDIMNMISPLGYQRGDRTRTVYHTLTQPEGIRELRNILDEGLPEYVLEYLSELGLDAYMLESIEGKIFTRAEEYIKKKEKEKEALQIQQMMATTPGLNQIPANVGPTIAHFVTGAYVPPSTGGSKKKKRKGAKKTRKMKRRGRKTVRK